MKSIPSQQAQPGRAIRIDRVCELTGVSRPTIWRLSKSDPTFPKPFKLSAAITCWDEGELLAWIAAKRRYSR